MKRYFFSLFFILLFLQQYASAKKNVVISIQVELNQKVQFGVQKLEKELTKHGYFVNINPEDVLKQKSLVIRIEYLDDCIDNPIITKNFSEGLLLRIREEGFALAGERGRYIIAGKDDTGILYGCMELIDRIKQEARLPDKIFFTDAPGMKLRGTCIGMQKTYVIPENGQYNYPYTPELFPFFYDKALWVRYLDMLLENRFNTLYLWNGHPFSSLVKLKEYPYALDVDEGTFQRNEEIFRFLTQEADKRGIWIIQMFYNIQVGVNFAKENGIPTHTGIATPLLEDYTRKSIAAFIEKYPNVGLLVCLGEALGPVDKDISWLNEVIIPGVKDGLNKLGLTKEPPLIIRGHNTDPPAVINAALPYYKNLYTMLKYNGEALTTYNPRGPWAKTHRELSRLGSTHIENVHLLANLEPFRWSSPDFVQKSVKAMHQVHGANGLHLYPQAGYWDWPYSADNTTPRLYQLDRDWLWYKAWGRYAWDDQRDSVSERRYWSELLGEVYDCRGHGNLILDAYQESGECAPKGLRRFGITDGNRQCYALGMFMPQLINREKFSPWIELWRSDSPEGEGLEEYVRKEMKGIPHKGETPPQIAHEIKGHGAKAVLAIEKASVFIRKNTEEFGRLKNDIHCINLLSNFYANKSKAAKHVLRYKYNANIEELDTAIVWLEKSVQDFERLTERTKNTYLYACSLQDKARKIPISGENGKNKHWSELLPLYKQELGTFRNNLNKLKKEGNFKNMDTGMLKLHPVSFELLSGDLKKYIVSRNVPVFTDQEVVFNEISPELNGLTGICFSEKKSIEQGIHLSFRVDVPAYVLVGYFNNTQPGFLPKPNLETNVFANERGGLEPVIRNATTFRTLDSAISNPIHDYPGIDVHAYKFEADKHEIDFDKGRFLILGIIDGKQDLKTRDSNLEPNETLIPVDWLFE